MDLDLAFFRACWDIVKYDIVEAIHDFFKEAALPRFYKASYTVLIPKLINQWV